MIKKSGFFVEAIKILDDLENEVEEELKHPIGDKKVTFNLKKEMFKINRDKGRLYALRRVEDKATISYEKCERILKQELYNGIEFNIKIAKTAP